MRGANHPKGTHVTNTASTPTTPATSPREWNRLISVVRESEVLFSSIDHRTHPGEKWDASVVREKAYNNLKAAFETVAWGRNGSAFITKRWSRGDGSYIVTLYLQGRRMATCNDGWVQLVDPAEAEKEFKAKRAAKREFDRAYKEERRRLIDAIEAANLEEPRNFGEWEYTGGQKGGTFHRPGTDLWIAAERAMYNAVRIEDAAYTEYDLETDRHYYRGVRRRHF